MNQQKMSPVQIIFSVNTIFIILLIVGAFVSLITRDSLREVIENNLGQEGFLFYAAAAVYNILFIFAAMLIILYFRNLILLNHDYFYYSDIWEHEAISLQNLNEVDEKLKTAEKGKEFGEVTKIGERVDIDDYPYHPCFMFNRERKKEYKNHLIRMSLRFYILQAETQKDIFSEIRAEEVNFLREKTEHEVYSLLDFIASAAPSLGFLGTIIGIVGVFSKVTGMGFNIAAIAAPMTTALITTLVGLIIKFFAELIIHANQEKVEKIFAVVYQRSIGLVSEAFRLTRQEKSESGMNKAVIETAKETITENSL